MAWRFFLKSCEPFQIMIVILEKNLKNNIMEKQVKSKFNEANSEKFYSEYALIDSSIINSVESCSTSVQLDSGIIFG